MKFPPGHKLFRARKTRKQRLSRVPKKRRGGGGAWRAFLKSRKLKAGAAAADEYQQLSREEKASFVQRGVLGSRAHQYGVPAFGQSNRAIL